MGLAKGGGVCELILIPSVVATAANYQLGSRIGSTHERYALKAKSRTADGAAVLIGKIPRNIRYRHLILLKRSA